MDLDIKIIRMIWAFIETSNPGSLVKLSDSELVQKLIEEMEKSTFLSPEDSKILSKYVGSRTPLIRDLAYAKLE